jgi:hypothetical protein
MIISDVITERFWAKVKVGLPDECWPWQAYTDKDTGYGKFGTHYPEVVGSHRYAFATENGDPGDLFVRHKCDNRPCCNPAHLIIGLHLDNMSDMVERGRHVGSSKLTIGEVNLIRVRRSLGESLEDLALEFDMSRPHVNAICNGTFWPHAGGPLTSKKIISNETLLAVLEDLKVLTRSQCADKYDISKASVAQIATGKRKIRDEKKLLVSDLRLNPISLQKKLACQ